MMASIEEYMIQKDKETAVMKKNYKHQILLNIELERIEKCKRTYEGFHHYEVAVMKTRRGKILRKKNDLRLIKMELAGNSVNLKFDERSHAENVRVKTCPEIARLDFSKIKPSRSKSDVSARIQENGGERVLSQKRTEYAEGRYVNGRCAEIYDERSTQSTVSTSLRQNKSKTESKTEKHALRFPVVTSRRSDDTREVRASQTPAVINRGNVGTSRNFTNFRKSKHHRENAEDISPFDRFRLRLHDSEEKSYNKHKVMLRSTSAMDAMREGSEGSAMYQRRSRSAVNL